MANFQDYDIGRLLNVFRTLPYFPTDPGAQAIIAEECAKMIPSLEALDWLRDMVLARVKVWPSLADIRGILCWKFGPADGIEADSSVAGFTPQDGERVSIERGALAVPQLIDGRVSECAQLRGMVEDLAARKMLPAPCCDLLGRKRDGSFCECRVGQFARELDARQAAEV